MGTQATMGVGLVMTITIIMLCGGAVGQLQQSSSGCTNSLVGLAPCLGYITGLVTVASSPCCRQLGSIVQSEPQCLCQLVSNNSSPLGIAINQDQALALPGACNLDTPPVSLCSLLNQPSGGSSSGGSSSSSPTDDSSATPGAPNPTPFTDPTISSSGTGTGTESTTESTSSGNITRFSIYLALFLLFITSSASATLLG